MKGMLPFDQWSLWINAGIFVAAGAVVWLAGTRLSRYAEEIARRTGIGKAVIGALMLGGITSLPEGATTAAASALGNAPLAVNNILGGVAMQVAILGLADVIVPGRALSSRVRQPAVLLQGVLFIGTLTLAAAGIAVGDTLVLGAGVWTCGILVAATLAFTLIHRFGNDAAWQPATPEERDTSHSRRGGERPHGVRQYSGARLGGSTLAASAAILAAGFALARSGDALADQSGLGASFVGVLFLAVATSLPEISTTLASVRLGEYTMAYSNIFGANILDTAILFVADAVYPGGPVLNEVGRFSLVAALLGIATTTVCLSGLLLRRKLIVLGAGVDSLLVLAVYVSGMVVLFSLR